MRRYEYHQWRSRVWRVKNYEREITKYIKNAKDVDTLSKIDLDKVFKEKRAIIKFKGVYVKNEVIYYLNLKDSGLLSQRPDGQISTLFKLSKHLLQTSSLFPNIGW